MAQIDLKNATIKIKDGTSPQNELEVKVGEGNISWTEKKPREYTLDRGVLDEVKDGDQEPMDVKMDFVWDYVKGNTGSGVPTISDALKQTGEAAGWLSSDTDDCRPYAVDIEIYYKPNCTGDTETITLPDFRYEQLDYDLRNGSVSCSGKCNALVPIIVRNTRSSGS